MAEHEKETKSILGLGLPQNACDPKWRPSKAARRSESGLSLTGAIAEKEKSAEPEKDTAIQARDSKTGTLPGANATERAAGIAAWRPSKVNEERLSSLSPARGRRRFAVSPRTRLLFTAVLFTCGAYFFVKVWLMPQAGELHVALVIAAAAMLLLFVSVIIGAARRRRHRKRGDPQSMLRL